MEQTTQMLGERYELGEVLGRGGMAEVHLGRDARLGRTVAIKVLRADMARDPAFQARFHREAMSAAGLNHPAIVAVYDTGEDVVAVDGRMPVNLPYIVMEHVAGRTVRDLLQESQGTGLGPERSIAITSGVLSALDYSHRHGIVHRDIKPANVMVTPLGEIKVMDFGIARAVADSSATMTQTSAVIGTAQYLSPEQARGLVVDERTDLYSTGCLLYELLTGRPPFVGESAVSLAYQHVQEEPEPPSAHNPTVSPGLDAVILRALAKDRADRYPNAAAFKEEMLAAASGRWAPSRDLHDATRIAGPLAGAAAGEGAQGLGTRVGAHAAARLVTDPAGRYEPLGVFGDHDAHGGAGGYDDDLPVRDDRRRRRWLIVAACTLVVALVAVGAWQLTAFARQVTVPSVTGSTYAAAGTKLTATGLTMHRTTTTSTAAAGTVTDQSPGEGAHVKRGSVVEVTVSSGPGSVKVPDVSNLTETQAANELSRLGLFEGKLTTKDAPGVPSDRMVGSDPAAGTPVKPGTRVSLVASSGRVTLPDLRGKSQNDAVAALNSLQLVAFVTEQPSDKAAGTVISQSPGAGPVDAGSHVTLVVAGAQATQAPTTAAPTTDPSLPPSTPAPSYSPSTPAPDDTTGAGADGDSPSPSASPTTTGAAARLGGPGSDGQGSQAGGQPRVNGGTSTPSESSDTGA